MDIRSLNGSDYDDILVDWWKDWGWSDPPSKDILPDNGECGAIVYQDDIPVCAGFLYTSNSELCWISWIISNKRYKDRKKRKESIKALIETLSLAGKETGNKYCYINFTGQHLVNVCEELGYVKGSLTQEMIKVWEN